MSTLYMHLKLIKRFEHKIIDNIKYFIYNYPQHNKEGRI